MIFPPTLETYLLSLTTSTPLAPLIIHLNADSSWLILLPLPSPSFPSPSSSTSTSTSTIDNQTRKYFSIVLDPWLKGTQTDVHRYLSRQTHFHESAFQSISEIEEFIERVEELLSTEKSKGKGRELDAGEKWIDAVVISAEFTDHCHRDTLEELRSDTRILATDKAAILIESWNHFDKVIEIPLFDSISTTSNEEYGLPDWIKLSRIVEPSEPLHFHSAISIIFELTSFHKSNSTTTTSTTAKSKRQNILFSPHGLSPSSLPFSPTSTSSTSPSLSLKSDVDSEAVAKEERIETLLLLHGIDTISLLGITINLGYNNALSVIEALSGGLGIKYWIRTHDEEKIGEGIVGILLKRIRKILPVVSGKDEDSSCCYKEVKNGDWLALV